MGSETTMVASQCRFREWTMQIRNCQTEIKECKNILWNSDYHKKGLVISAHQASDGFNPELFKISQMLGAIFVYMEIKNVFNRHIKWLLVEMYLEAIFY